MLPRQFIIFQLLPNFSKRQIPYHLCKYLPNDMRVFNCHNSCAWGWSQYLTSCCIYGIKNRYWKINLPKKLWKPNLQHGSVSELKKSKNTSIQLWTNRRALSHAWALKIAFFKGQDCNVKIVMWCSPTCDTGQSWAIFFSERQVFSPVKLPCCWCEPYYLMWWLQCH